MRPRDIPFAPRAKVADLLAGRARVVGSRTQIGRDDLGLVPGMISPYETRETMGLRYGDPPIEEARYERGRTTLGDVSLVARWAITRIAKPSAPAETRRHLRPYVVAANVDAIDTADAIARILGMLRERRGGSVFFVHPHALNLAARDADFRAELARGSLVLPDGVGLRVASSILGEPLPANVNGTDLVPELLVELAADRIPVALVGGAPGVAIRAGEAWSKRTGVGVIASWDGYQNDAAYSAMAERLRDAGPCVVLVALGSPRQERFVLRYLEGLPNVVATPSAVSSILHRAKNRARRSRCASSEWSGPGDWPTSRVVSGAAICSATRRSSRERFFSAHADNSSTSAVAGRRTAHEHIRHDADRGGRPLQK